MTSAHHVRELVWCLQESGEYVSWLDEHDNEFLFCVYQHIDGAWRWMIADSEYNMVAPDDYEHASTFDSPEAAQYAAVVAWEALP